MSDLYCFEFIAFAIKQAALCSDWQSEISRVASSRCHVLPEGLGFEVIPLLLVAEFEKSGRSLSNKESQI